MARAAAWSGRGERLAPFVHVLTHRDWTLAPLRWTLPARARAPDGLEGRWFTPEEALALGLPAPIRRLLLSR